MKIDLKARLKSKYFWIALGSTILLVGQTFGMDMSEIPVIGNYEEVVNTVFAMLIALGAAVDTSTPGIGD
jgi:uncharacterized membrane protein